jgi:hypothetical protein
MGRKSYLGGSTILGPRDNPYRTENSPHQYLEDYSDRPRCYFYGQISESLFDELAGFDFTFISEIFSCLQHAFLHGDLTAITRLAEQNDYLGNYILRLMNATMIGRKFDKEKGQIVIKKLGKLQWDVAQIIAVHQAMVTSHDPDCDQLPLVSPTVQMLIDERGFSDASR